MFGKTSPNLDRSTDSMGGMNTFARLQLAALATAYSDGGPTHAQAEAGNYKKGRVSIHGLPIAIECPRGSYRTGRDASGKEWRSFQPNHYGHFEKFKGADGDGLDVFVGPIPTAETVWVVNQIDSSGKFDEHKVMLGFASQESAQAAYLGAYSAGWRGLGSMVQCSIEQLKWWLKYGNVQKPLALKNLPFDGGNSMSEEILWDSAANPVNNDLAGILYALRRDDADGLLLDAVTADSILADSDGVMALDALVIPFNRLERKMEQMQKAMGSAADALSVTGMQVTEPFKQRGTTNVAAIFELSDGQTVTIFFHNPDTTPNKITPDDEMVSWKWLLNRKDVTILVAPERGADLNVREVSRRVMRLAEKNSARFAQANAKKAERMAGIESLKQSVEAKEAELGQLQAEITDLTAKVEAKRAASPASLQGQSTGVAATQAEQPATVQGAAPDRIDYDGQGAGTPIKGDDAFNRRYRHMQRQIAAVGGSLVGPDGYEIKMEDEGRVLYAIRRSAQSAAEQPAAVRGARTLQDAFQKVYAILKSKFGWATTTYGGKEYPEGGVQKEFAGMQQSGGVNPEGVGRITIANSKDAVLSVTYGDGLHGSVMVSAGADDAVYEKAADKLNSDAEVLASAEQSKQSGSKALPMDFSELARAAVPAEFVERDAPDATGFLGVAEDGLGVRVFDQFMGRGRHQVVGRVWEDAGQDAVHVETVKGSLADAINITVQKVLQAVDAKRKQPGGKLNPSEVDSYDALRDLGEVAIYSLGSENTYMRKGGKHYVTKLLPTQAGYKRGQELDLAALADEIEAKVSAAEKKPDEFTEKQSQLEIAANAAESFVLGLSRGKRAEVARYAGATGKALDTDADTSEFLKNEHPDDVRTAALRAGLKPDWDFIDPPSNTDAEVSPEAAEEAEAQSLYRAFDRASVKMPTAVKLGLKKQRVLAFSDGDKQGFSNGHFFAYGVPKMIAAAIDKYHGGFEKLQQLTAAQVERVTPKAANVRLEPVAEFESSQAHTVVLVNQQAGVSTAIDYNYFAYFDKQYKQPDYFTLGVDESVLVKKSGEVVGVIMPVRITDNAAVLKRALRASGASDEATAKAAEAANSNEPKLEEIRHLGRRIYQVRGGRWVVQSEDNYKLEQNGERQIGGDLYVADKEAGIKEVEEAAARTKANDEYRQAQAAKIAAEEAKEAEKRAYFDDFFAYKNYTAANQQRAYQKLTKQAIFGGKAMTFAERVESTINAGGHVGEAAGQRTLVNADDSFLFESDIGKFAMDYAEFLLSRGAHEPVAAKATEKPFEVGGVKFTAIRKAGARPYWMLRIDESGEVHDPANGAWFKSDTMANMVDDIERIFEKRYDNDSAKFRKGLGLPDGAVEASATQSEDTALTEAKALLQSIIDGNADMLDSDLGNKMLKVHDDFTDDEEIMEMFERAAKAYSDNVVAQAKKALAG